MASTFREMFDYFKDHIKTYTAQSDVTEHIFMLRISKAMVAVQRETEVLWRETQIALGNNVNNPNSYTVPADLERPITIYDQDDLPIVLTGYVQQKRIADQMRQNGAYLENPVDYQYRIRHLYGSKTANDRITRTASFTQRRIDILPLQSNDTFINVKYVCKLSPFSKTSTEWSPFFTNDADFMDNFRNATLGFDLDKFEDAIVAHAIADHIQAVGNINYRVYEQKYREIIGWYKADEPTYNLYSNVPYQFGIHA